MSLHDVWHEFRNVEIGDEFVQILHVELVLSLNFVYLGNIGVGMGVVQEGAVSLPSLVTWK